jgi:2-methylisocitrate lyase-like PEP mutase family enzyme
MTIQAERAREFRALHHADTPLLIPNPWDIGSARILASMGFFALATTSGGFAMSLGRLDGNVTRDEALAHAAVIVGATDLPVSADLENGFAHAPGEVAQTIDGAKTAGLVGGSIEDFTTDMRDPIYDIDLAAARIEAAAERSHHGEVKFVLTARAENYLRRRPDLGDTITRLQRYQEAGADVLYAPGLSDIADVRTLVQSVDRPVNVLAWPGLPPVHELAAAGVKRISVGGSFACAAIGALVEAANELRELGTYTYFDLAGVGRQQINQAFPA